MFLNHQDHQVLLAAPQALNTNPLLADIVSDLRCCPREELGDLGALGV